MKWEIESIDDGFSSTLDFSHANLSNFDRLIAGFSPFCEPYVVATCSRCWHCCRASQLIRLLQIPAQDRPKLQKLYHNHPNHILHTLPILHVCYIICFSRFLMFEHPTKRAACCALPRGAKLDAPWGAWFISTQNRGRGEPTSARFQDSALRRYVWCTSNMITSPNPLPSRTPPQTSLAALHFPVKPS